MEVSVTAEICPKCGLPREICVCGAIEKEVEKIKVYVTKAKFKKLVTIVAGIDKNDIEAIGRELKRRLACGGTAKGGQIILQGNHKAKIKQILVSLGYPEENITT